MTFINQLGGYSKEMLDTELPLRSLLKSRKEFQWMAQHTEGFEVVYCPKIDEHNKNFALGWEAFQSRLPSLQKEDYCMREEPTRPFQMFGSDFFSNGNREYLAHVDRASKQVSVVSFNKIGVSTKE